MSKEIYISSTPHETRLAIVEQDQLAEIYYERENEYTLAGSIYKGRVTRVLPGMQSSFVDVGLERDAFLYVTDFMEEVGEGADFDSSDGGGQRRSRGASRGSDRNPDRSAERAPEAGGESARADGRAAESRNGDAGASEGRGGEARTGEGRNQEGRNRDGRGGRSRGRGRNGERSQSQFAPAAAPEQTAQPAQPLAVSEETDAGDAGEGAPGADGTRRWRGRRGRRRGRGSAGARPDAATSGHAVPLDLAEENGAAFSAEEDAPVAPHSPAAQYDSPAPQSRRNEPTHTPSPDLSGQQTAVPFLLPGESLSKYRRGEKSAASQPGSSSPAATLSQPSTVFELGSSWDGSSQLPGETLSRHRRGSEAPPQAFARQPEQRPATPAVETHPATVVSEPAEKPAEIVPHKEEELVEGAASHRVDLSPPSEYRQSFVEEPEIEAEAAQTSTEHGDAVEWADPSPIQPTESKPIEPEPSAQIADFTAAAADARSVDATEQHSFAASSGVMEEEILDEEEYDFDPMEARSDDNELDDLEEETLDGAADLGSMVRDMHLEERTRSTEPDPLDEEFAEADGEEEDFNEASYFETDAEAGTDADEEDDGEPSGEGAADAISQNGDAGAAPSDDNRARREGGRDGRSRGGRDGRRGSERRGDRGSSDRGGDRRRSGSGGGRGRQSMQMGALPIISDLLKPGQEILVQIAKEPMAKKGARITSHIALPGRFLVFMPTVNHVGVSRKIESDEERHRLKRILLSEKGEAGGGFIVRTAADGASEDELRSDLRFLINLWSDIKTRSDSSKAPALIYHDLNLVERILRDQVTDTFSAIWVDTEAEYERVLRFLQRFQPSLIRRVKLYTKETPLFEQFGITAEIDTALKSKVWLKSGGSIVINQTEALVAIDINTGKYVGKTARLEDTIVRTNLDAIPEIVRQIRLRDLGGIIVIDFIDMDDRKNRNRVMAALEDELKNDRAPSKVLHFNDFGLVAITRKRVKQSLERTLSIPCGVCTGTGMTKSPVTVCNEIYIEMRKMHKHLERADIMLRVHPEVVKQLKTNTGRWLVEMEEMAGKTILVKSDPSLHPEQFDIH